MNIELFKDAIAVIDGIPAKRIYMNSWQFYHPLVITDAKHINSKTKCCAGGWLALYPPFQARGLYVSSLDGSPCYKDKQYSFALAKFFGLSEEEAKIFHSLTEEEAKIFRRGLGSNSSMHKRIWLNRAKKLLAKYQVQA